MTRFPRIPGPRTLGVIVRLLLAIHLGRVAMTVAPLRTVVLRSNETHTRRRARVIAFVLANIDATALVEELNSHYRHGELWAGLAAAHALSYLGDTHGSLRLHADLAEKGAADSRYEIDLARCLIRNAEYQNAASILAQYVRPKRKSSVGLYTDLARCYELLDRYEEAADELRKAVECSSRDTRARIALGRILIRLERDGEAAHALRDIRPSSLTPSQRAEYLSLLARIDLHAHNLSSSGQLLREAIQIDPENAMNHATLAFVYKEQGELEKSMEEADEALRQQPDNSFAHAVLASGYLEQGRFEKAICSAQTALELYPEGLPAKEIIEQARAGLARQDHQA